MDINATMNETAINATIAAKKTVIEYLFTVKTLTITLICVFVVLCVALYILYQAWPYVLFALRLGRKINKWGYNNVGFMFLRNKSNNFNFPELIDLRQTKKERHIGDKIETFVYSREQLENGKFFGFPYVIFDDDDNKTSIGLYYHQSDENGNPLFEDVLVGFSEKKEPILRKRPLLTTFKPAVTMPPSFYRVIIDGERMTKALVDFFEKYRVIIYCVLGVGVLVIAVGGIAYYIYNKQIPQVI